MRGIVVLDLEYSLCTTIRLSAPHIGNQPLKGGNPQLSLAPSEDLRPFDVPCSHVVAPRTRAWMLVFSSEQITYSCAARVSPPRIR
jgi:hypothetical protein